MAQTKHKQIERVSTSRENPVLITKVVKGSTSAQIPTGKESWAIMDMADRRGVAAAEGAGRVEAATRRVVVAEAGTQMRTASARQRNVCAMSCATRGRVGRSEKAGVSGDTGIARAIHCPTKLPAGAL